MADYNILIKKRNAGNTGWDTFLPVTIATNVGTASGKNVEEELALRATKAVATTSANGLMSSTDKTKLDGVAANANNYSHPTGDGNLHVPATGTKNNGKVLKAGATAGSAAWGNLTAADVGAVPTSRTVNGNPLSANISLAASDVQAYSKTEIDDRGYMTTKSLPANHDPDTVINNGRYLIEYSAVLNNKKPSGYENGAFYIDVIASNALYVYQEWTLLYSPEVKFIRVKEDGVWSKFREIAITDNMIVFKPVPAGVTKIFDLVEPALYQLSVANTQFTDFPSDLTTRGLVYGTLEVLKAGHTNYRMILSNSGLTAVTEVIGFRANPGDYIKWMEIPDKAAVDSAIGQMAYQLVSESEIDNMEPITGLPVGGGGDLGDATPIQNSEIDNVLIN